VVIGSRFHQNMPVCRMGVKHSTHREKEYRQNLGMRGFQKLEQGYT
jgi:hypothetical protein